MNSDSVSIGKYHLLYRGFIFNPMTTHYGSSKITATKDRERERKREREGKRVGLRDGDGGGWMGKSRRKDTGGYIGTKTNFPHAYMTKIQE